MGVLADQSDQAEESMDFSDSGLKTLPIGMQMLFPPFTDQNSYSYVLAFASFKTTALLMTVDTATAAGFSIRVPPYQARGFVARYRRLPE